MTEYNQNIIQDKMMFAGIDIQGVTSSTIIDQQGHQLPVLLIENQFCQAMIAAQGAQILSFKPKLQDLVQDDVLWNSQHSCLNGQKAIRGGIPLCFPWFGAHATDEKYPAHGFARQQAWQLLSLEHDPTQGHRITFQLTDNALSQQYWAYAFELQLCIECGQDLKLNLKVKNCDQNSFDFHFAWHSYFAVQSIHQTKITGLENSDYFDKLAPLNHTPQANQREALALSFKGEIDRIYPFTQEKLSIHSNTILQVSSTYCASAVVWNPWQEKTQTLADLAKDDWQKFICLETGNVLDAIQSLKAAEQKVYSLKISRL